MLEKRLQVALALELDVLFATPGDCIDIFSICLHFTASRECSRQIPHHFSILRDGTSPDESHNRLYLLIRRAIHARDEPSEGRDTLGNILARDSLGRVHYRSAQFGVCMLA